MDIVHSRFPLTGVVWVPCIPNYATGAFVPVYTLANMIHEMPNNIVALPRGGIKTKSWSHEEDLVLKELVAEFGIKKWAKIAKAINEKFTSDRKGKNCRERWNNHLNPDINKGEWTYEEDLKLINEFRVLGKKWSMISKTLIGRTENAVKNRWNTLMKSVQQTAGFNNYEMATEFLVSHLKRIIDEKMVETNNV
ncbi:hypothetical protein SteCoe_33140 [Stentor coeruleus]|uniref:Uncharacterized protein n=1 Tax=Stentor coeruleus TaxID=5963 RepID=A0A1R2AXV5_9CILI|nr:hypothetical protein SteCoe_33140 [Stentor coeruleus]